MADLDLLGDPVREPIKGTVPSGYARLPGTGPTGKTCATCKHAVRAGRYAKCGANVAHWTHGVKSDIRLRTPACSLWEQSSSRGEKHET